jgi:pyruvate formate lyase activating enzyme
MSGQCTHCRRCRTACPLVRARRAPGIKESSQEVECSLCGACVRACPTGARVIIGRKMTVSQVIDEIMADRIFYDDSKGGATFSGGEPLMQFAFLRELLESCRACGIQTALDTCGFGPTDHLLAVAPLADIFLFDLKAFDSAKHRSFTGVSNELILGNLQALGRIHDQIWLRIPIIPGVNNSAAELDQIACFASEIPGIRQVNLLPYHRTGAHKFGRLGQEYSLSSLAPPTREAMEEAATPFRAAGFKVLTGG